MSRRTKLLFKKAKKSLELDEKAQRGSGGPCAKEKNAIGNATNQQSRGKALHRYMLCKRGH